MARASLLAWVPPALLLAFAESSNAHAQSGPAAGEPPSSAAPASTGPQNGIAPAASAAPPSGANAGATGYGYSRQPEARSVRRSKPPPKGPYATMPGFETRQDGTTRLFVALSTAVPVEEKKAQGTLTYVLKGAQLGHGNNGNALVTVHFNTPVTRARLVPSGKDLLFVIDLRAAVPGTHTMTTAKDGGAVLMIDFPKGEYLPQGARLADAPLDAPVAK